MGRNQIKYSSSLAELNFGNEAISWAAKTHSLFADDGLYTVKLETRWNGESSTENTAIT